MIMATKLIAMLTTLENDGSYVYALDINQGSCSNYVYVKEEKDEEKSIIILGIICIVLIVLIPITVLGSLRIKVVVEEELSREEFNKKRQREKEEWINSQMSISSTYSSSNENTTIDKELIDKYIRGENEAKEERKKIDEIIDRFYPEKNKELSNKMSKNADKMSLDELYDQEYSREFFSLIINIIKNKDITIEEKNILKEFLEQPYYDIKNPEMKLKFEEVLSEE